MACGTSNWRWKSKISDASRPTSWPSLTQPLLLGTQRLMQLYTKNGASTLQVAAIRRSSICGSSTCCRTMIAYAPENVRVLFAESCANSSDDITEKRSEATYSTACPRIAALISTPTTRQPVRPISSFASRPMPQPKSSSTSSCVGRIASIIRLPVATVARSQNSSAMSRGTVRTTCLAAAMDF